MQIVGAKITKYRMEKRFSQQELSEMIGVSQSVISAWESDQCQPRSKYIDSLAKELGVKIEDLMPESNKKNDIQDNSQKEPTLYEVNLSIVNELLLTQRNLISAIEEQNLLLRVRRFD